MGTMSATGGAGGESEVVESATPASGATVQLANNNRNGLMFLDPAGLLPTLTITLPSEANSRIGQLRRVTCSKAITLLTINGAATIYNAPAAMAIGDGFTLIKCAPNTWAKI